MRGGDGLRGRTLGRRRLAQKLAVSGVAEIEIAMTGAAGDKVGTGGDGLRFQGFERSVGRALGCDDGGDRGFKVQGNDRGQAFAVGLDFERAVIVARDFSGNRENEVGWIISAAGDGERGCTDRAGAGGDEDTVFGDSDARGISAGTSFEDDVLGWCVQDQRGAGRGGYF